MAETLLQSWLSPKSAEAKITGDKESMDALRAIIEKAKSNHEYLTQIYDKVIKRAESVPQTVEMHAAPGLADIYGGAAEFKGDKIYYDPQYKGQELNNSLVHELLHFLNSLSGTPIDTDTSHDIIKHLIGTSTYKPAVELEGYTASEVPEKYKDVLKNWLGD